MKICLSILTLSTAVRIAIYWPPMLEVLLCSAILSGCVYIILWWMIAYNAAKKFSNDAAEEFKIKDAEWKEAQKYDRQAMTDKADELLNLLQAAKAYHELCDIEEGISLWKQVYTNTAGFVSQHKVVMEVLELKQKAVRRSEFVKPMGNMDVFRYEEE